MSYETHNVPVKPQLNKMYSPQPHFDHYKPETESFEEYLKRFERHLRANSISEDKKKVIFLLNCLGPITYAKLRKLTRPEKPQDLSFSQIVSKLTELSQPRRQLQTIERYNLRKRTQQPGEPFNKFLEDVKSIASNCGFDDPKRLEEEIRDQVIYGMKDISIQKYFLQQPPLALSQVISKAQSDEPRITNTLS